MKTVLSFGLFLLIASTTIFAQKGDYKLVWQDDFNYTTAEITKRWTIEENGNGGGNNELQYYKKENITTGRYPKGKEQCLILTAKKENYRSKTCTSGRITTQDQISFLYGKVEARIKLPKTENGLWPAFWLLGADIQSVNWPRCGEIDIIEMGNEKGINENIQDRFFNGACHWGEDFNNGNYPNFAKHITNDYSLQNKFHLFTMEWTPDSISFYVDADKFPNRAPYFSMAISGDSAINQPSRYFHKPFFIIFNVAVGGNFTKIYNIDKVTALNETDTSMYIDYIKVYQKEHLGQITFGKSKVEEKSIANK